MDSAVHRVQIVQLWRAFRADYIVRVSDVGRFRMSVEMPQFSDYFSSGALGGRVRGPHASELFDESQFPDGGAAEVGFAN